MVGNSTDVKGRNGKCGDLETTARIGTIYTLNVAYYSARQANRLYS